jgi:hypothetical protein
VVMLTTGDCASFAEKYVRNLVGTSTQISDTVIFKAVLWNGGVFSEDIPEQISRSIVTDAVQHHSSRRAGLCRETNVETARKDSIIEESKIWQRCLRNAAVS